MEGAAATVMRSSAAGAADPGGARPGRAVVGAGTRPARGGARPRNRPRRPARSSLPPVHAMDQHVRARPCAGGAGARPEARAGVRGAEEAGVGGGQHDRGVRGRHHHLGGGWWSCPGTPGRTRSPRRPWTSPGRCRCRRRDRPGPGRARWGWPGPWPASPWRGCPSPWQVRRPRCRRRSRSSRRRRRRTRRRGCSGPGVRDEACARVRCRSR